MCARSIFESSYADQLNLVDNNQMEIHKFPIISHCKLSKMARFIEYLQPMVGYIYHFIPIYIYEMSLEKGIKHVIREQKIKR